MNARNFASLGSSAFSVLASKRQALVAASAFVEAVMAADPCDRVCCCDKRPAYDVAVKAEADAYNTVRIAEASWAEFCAIRYA